MKVQIHDAMLGTISRLLASGQ